MKKIELNAGTSENPMILFKSKNSFGADNQQERLELEKFIKM